MTLEGPWNIGQRSNMGRFFFALKLIVKKLLVMELWFFPYIHTFGSIIIKISATGSFLKHIEKGPLYRFFFWLISMTLKWSSMSNLYHEFNVFVFRLSFMQKMIFIPYLLEFKPPSIWSRTRIKAAYECIWKNSSRHRVKAAALIQTIYVTSNDVFIC
jgi:hypothetical protein